jgi:hypothetical protein
VRQLRYLDRFAETGPRIEFFHAFGLGILDAAKELPGRRQRDVQPPQSPLSWLNDVARLRQA